MNSMTKISRSEVNTDDDVNLSDRLSILIAGWRTIIVTSAVVVLLGAAYAFLSNPVYRADALIQVEDSSSSTASSALGELATLFDSKAIAAAEMELMRSRLVVGDTVRDLHLDITAEPRYFPILGSLMARGSVAGQFSSPLFGLGKFAWGGERITVTQFDVPKNWLDEDFVIVAKSDGKYTLTSPSDGQILEGQVGKKTIVNTGKGEISIYVDTLIGRQGTEFVVKRASTTQTINTLQDKLKIAENEKQSGVISIKLDGSDNEKNTATVNSIARKYVQQNIDRKSAEAEHTLAFLDQQLPQLRKELDDAEQRYNNFRNKKGTVDLGEESKLLLQQIVDDSSKMLALQQQRQELAQRFSEEHPVVAGLNSQISALQQDQERLGHQVSVLPNTEQTALRLLRDVRVDTELYTNLLNSVQQLRILKAGQVGDAWVVDYAVPADEPVRPKKILLLVLSLAIGLILGAAAALVRQRLFGGVEHAEKIEEILDVPVYAAVPHSARERRLKNVNRRDRIQRSVLTEDAPEDVAVEAIRSLRTALQFGSLSATNNVIMVTGPRPEVGKSFLSVNLAAVLASGGERVLLIDADMRRGDLHEYFAMPARNGLSEVLRGTNADDIIVRDALPGLDLLKKGSVPPNPAELLSSPIFGQLLEKMSGEYDKIIVDTPPVLAVADPTIIGKHAAITLLVLRHGRHPASEITEVAKRLRNGGVSLKGVLFTDIPQQRLGNGSYYTGYYGYESKSE
ncbi:polysaccharide biosynthesis tyrosine autokinase [Paraburkholderia metrosideri]|uniref:Polysaccharide biosynthesis tyrosine autokinase n=1 Tax=Paraburkholderia metrosideri TaxID=580937 RepID=A0ABW9E062_9BURK